MFRSVGALSAALNDEVLDSDMASNASRVMLDRVEYDVVREFRYGPELTIGVRPPLAG
jgi:hypothetical protein